MKQELARREAQESPGFSRGEDVKDDAEKRDYANRVILDAIYRHPDLYRDCPSRFADAIRECVDCDIEPDVDRIADAIRDSMSYKAWKVLRMLRIA